MFETTMEKRTFTVNYCVSPPAAKASFRCAVTHESIHTHFIYLLLTTKYNLQSISGIYTRTNTINCDGYKKYSTRDQTAFGIISRPMRSMIVGNETTFQYL